MAGRASTTRSWLWTLVVLLLIAIPGFGLGLVAGVAWEEPSLLGSHLLGGTTEVAVWAPPETTRDPAAQLAPVIEEPAPLPDVAAKPAVPAARPAPPAAPPKPAPRAAPAPPTPAPRAAPAPAQTGRFAVQVGAFAEAASAEQLAGRLRAKGFVAYVSPGVAAGEARWRVRVGPTATREESERVAARLKAQEQLPTWVLDENSAG